MAPVTPPVWEQAGSFSAKSARQGLSSLLQPESSIGALVARSGVSPRGGTNSMQVSQRATPDMNVTVAPGTCHIAATSTTGGIYACVNDASYDVAVSASHATLARKDLVCARVYDAIDDTGALNQFSIEVIAGTPASSPSRPATPNQALALAEVLVPAASTSVVTGNITDLRFRTVASGGIIPVRSSSELPVNPYPGQAVFREDFNQFHFRDNTSWRTLQFGAWTSYTPTLSASTTNPTLGTGSIRNGSFTQLGKVVIVNANVVFGTSGTNAGSGTYRISLPITAKTLTGGYHVGSAFGNDTSANNGVNGVARVGSTSGYDKAEMMLQDVLVTNSNPIAWGVSDILSITIIYEAA